MAIDDEDLPRPAEWQPKNLAPLSIDQLEEYIRVLEAEITRVRKDIAAKQDKRSAADAFFKK